MDGQMKYLDNVGEALCTGKKNTVVDEREKLRHGVPQHLTVEMGFRDQKNKISILVTNDMIAHGHISCETNILCT